MSLIPYNPFREIEDWFEESIRTPRADVYEEDNNVVAEIELPGVNPQDIDVEVQDQTLKIEARSEEKKEEKKKGYYRKELSRGYYQRILPLPVEVKEEQTEAFYEQGVLKVVMPKQKPEEKEEKRVKIKVKTKEGK